MDQLTMHWLNEYRAIVSRAQIAIIALYAIVAFLCNKIRSNC